MTVYVENSKELAKKLKQISSYSKVAECKGNIQKKSQTLFSYGMNICASLKLTFLNYNP